MTIDLTPEAVEAEAAEFEKCADLSFFRSNDDYRRTAATLRALSARVVELKAERDEAIGANILNRNAVRMQQVKRHASERALATARADALREAAKWCNDEAERCDDASRWGGSRKYVADCKAAAYALHNARHKIEALIPQEKPHE